MMLHEDARARIAELAAGVLEGEERARVEEHAARCDECRAELEAQRGLVEAFRELAPALHPPPEALAAWALGAPGLPEDAERRTAKHVLACRDCREDARRVRAADRELDRKAGADAASRRPLRGGWLAAAAALLALLILAPFAWRGLAPGRAAEADVPAASGPAEIVPLVGLQRDTGAEPVSIEAPSESRTLVLAIAPVLPESLRSTDELRIALRAEGGRTLLETGSRTEGIERALAETGYVALVVSPGLLEPGRYSVDVLRGEAEGGSELLWSAPFLVRAGASAAP